MSEAFLEGNVMACHFLPLLKLLRGILNRPVTFVPLLCYNEVLDGHKSKLKTQMMKGNVVSVTVRIKISQVIYSYFKGLFLGTKEMAQLVKYGLSKHEDWVLVPSTHVKARCYVEARSPYKHWARGGDRQSLEFTAQPRLISELQDQIDHVPINK